MKKLCIIALVFVLIFTLAACGRRNDDNTNNTTLPTTVPTTEKILPEMDPTSATNIPDPDVNGAVPDGTDGMEDILDDMTGDNTTGNGNNGTSGNGTMGSTSGNTGNK